MGFLSKIGDVFEDIGDTIGDVFSGLLGGGANTYVPQAQPLKTDTGLGVEAQKAKTFDEDELKSKTVKKKKLGAKALQIPLAKKTASTGINITPTNGVQI